MNIEHSVNIPDVLAEINRQSLRHTVLHHIRQAIITGDLVGGQQLNENELVRQIGVSRGLVREVLREMESSGIVVSIPYRGTYVRHWTVKDVREVYTIRSCLEKLAAELAVPLLTDGDINDLADILEKIKSYAIKNDMPNLIRCDMDFHLRLAAVSGNELLVKLLNDLSGQTQMIITAIALKHIKGSFPHDQVESHQAILEVVRMRDPYLLSKVINDHIWSYGEQLCESMHVESNSKYREK